MSGESTFGASIAKFTSLPPVARMSFASYQFLSENTAQYSGSLSDRDCGRIARPAPRRARARPAACRNASHSGGAPAGSGPADGARSKSPLQVTERSPRMLSVSSALICPAFGMPTRMPNCCCTLGSEIVGSMRPNSKGRPAYSLKSGNTFATATVVVGKVRARRRAPRPVAGGIGAPSAVTKRRARAVVGLGAIEIGLHHRPAGGLPALDGVLHVRDRGFLDAEQRLGPRRARRGRRARQRTATVRRNARHRRLADVGAGWGLAGTRTERRRRLAVMRRRLVGRRRP